MGVAPKQKGKARQAFQRSANSAGYFWSGPNRLVRPAIKGSAAPAAVPEGESEKPAKKKDKERKSLQSLYHPPDSASIYTI
jgi:hypothetical protein